MNEISLDFLGIGSQFVTCWPHSASRAAKLDRAIEGAISRILETWQFNFARS